MKWLVYSAFHPNLFFETASFNREVASFLFDQLVSGNNQTMLDLPHNRHSMFYFTDGTIILLVLEPTCETLYKLYPGFPTRHSPVFEAMLSLPQSSSLQTTEGQSDDNPIVLHGIVQQEFNHLLCYLHGQWFLYYRFMRIVPSVIHNSYDGSDSELECQEFLTSVLKLSDFYQINSGFWYAVAELKHLSPAAFEPSLKLQFGHQFQINKWVEPSFHVLMEHQPLLSINHLEAHQMGMEYFWILVTMKAQIEEHYPALAYTKPALNQSNDCQTPWACATVWKEEWWNGIARHLLHPESPCQSQSAIIALLQETDFDGGICASCKAGIMLKLKNSPVLRYEEDQEDIAAVFVMDAQIDGYIG
ncbi:hypothetical protein BS17DRAFT_807042 [Gyrodon lividus]|nr:hypothetical protein BS17DRAFT_807042 [Gyrodon lividus]